MIATGIVILVLAAAATSAGLPTLVAHIHAGKYFLRGLTAGAVKG